MKKFALAALAVASLATGAAQAQTQGVTDDEILIGGFHDLSGIFAAFSVPAVQAAQQYFDEVNAAGGVHGRTIRYIVEDHGYQVPRAAQAANSLVNRDGVFAMLLALGTPHNLAAFRIMDTRNVPSVFPLTAARQMADGPQELRYTMTASYYDAIRQGVGYIAEANGRTQACSMYIPSDFGEEIHMATVDEAGAMDGVSYVTETTHRPDETDYSGAIARLRAEGCDLVTVALGIRQTITAVGTARAMGWTDVDFLVSSAGFHTAIAKVPGGPAEGLYAAAGWQDLEARATQPEVGAWIQAYAAASGEDFPGTGALLGRSAAEAMVRGLEAAGPDLTVESFQAGMESLNYSDVIAGNQVQMGEDDHAGAESIYISQIQDGSWALVDQVD